jgi:hypothetical protein
MKPTVVPTTFALLTALALAIAPKAHADGRGCSNATLKGRPFAYTSVGAIVAAPDPSIVGPYAEVGVQAFDGQGNVTFSYNASLNGTPGPGTATGTYTVNEDCTGTFTETSDGFTSNFSFVTSEDGKDFQAICQDPGAVITRSAKRESLR